VTTMSLKTIIPTPFALDLQYYSEQSLNVRQFILSRRSLGEMLYSVV